jgi:hypothetical protein
VTLAAAHDQRARIKESARVAGYGVLVYGATRFAGTYLERYAFAAAVMQLVIAEWGAGRMAIAWSDPLAPAPTTTAIALRAARGAALGLAAALVALGVVLLTRAGSLAPNAPSVVVSLMGAITPACLAARDELLLRGLVLRVLPADLQTSARVAACGLASAAAAYGDGASAPPALVAAGLGGAALGALWMHDRGVWLAWGAHAAFAWASGTLAKGGLVDLRPASNGWGGADLSGSWAAVLAATITLGGALAFAFRPGAAGNETRRGEPR